MNDRSWPRRLWENRDDGLLRDHIQTRSIMDRLEELERETRPSGGDETSKDKDLKSREAIYGSETIWIGRCADRISLGRGRGSVKMNLALPRYVIAKRLKSGRTAFYFNVPKIYLSAGCPHLTNRWATTTLPLADITAMVDGRQCLTDCSTSGIGRARGCRFFPKPPRLSEASIGCFKNSSNPKPTRRKSRSGLEKITSGRCARSVTL